MQPITFILQLAALTSTALAVPTYHAYRTVVVPQTHYDVLAMRASTEVNPAAVLQTTCIDPNVHIVSHEQNVAELGICGGIAGTIVKCGGSPTSTTGQFGSAKFSLQAVQPGATINISKGRWEQCVRAARAVCPTGSMSATCAGGASSGDVSFTLSNP